MDKNLLVLSDALQAKFGHTSFREGQKEIMVPLLQGNHVLGIMSTGGGKSLTYQLPAYLFPGITLVVSPLISLMVDQVQKLQKHGHRYATYLNSSLDRDEMRIVMEEVVAGVYQLLYISPEKLMQPQVISLLRKRGVSLVAIDEAHCISQWGHDFRTDYLKLPDLVNSLGNPLVLAVTATATAEVQREIGELFQILPEHQVRLTVNRPTIAIDVKWVKNDAEKQEILFSQLKELRMPGIVYCSTRQTVDKLVAKCHGEGLHRVSGFHGGMNPMERILIQEQFVQNQLDIIFATNAFGMGIDKPDIRFVLHYHTPSSMEAYTQEIGRIGRDNQPGYACLYYREEDLLIHHRLFAQEYPTVEEVIRFIHLFARNQEEFNTLTHEQLFEEVGVGENVTRLLFYYAEKAGAISSVHQLKNGYEIRKNVFQPEQMIEQLWGIIQQVKSQKYQKLKGIQDWLQGDSCLRGRMLTYFGEEMAGHHVVNCCVHCGIDPTMYEKKEMSVEIPTRLVWDLKTALSQLLPGVTHYEKGEHHEDNP
ncbi:RecQ family ATP-dependent DNA helicase [Brevibacillus daliensis]|uniref:RecQ family ATP-dependent DNA helicase n=1 Tax=Brevibacillus daliensis TaxID=2892995 RepID=UPI001E4D0D97|nr:RecQ family ATP-dependent DNA helicase [Brevibacillus daliensis]